MEATRQLMQQSNLVALCLVAFSRSAMNKKKARFTMKPRKLGSRETGFLESDWSLESPYCKENEALDKRGKAT